MCYIVKKLLNEDFPAKELLVTGIYKLIRSFCKTDQSTNIVFTLYTKWKNQLLVYEQQKQQKSASKSGLPIQTSISFMRVTESEKNNENYSSAPGVSEKAMSNTVSNLSSDKFHHNPLEEGGLKTKNSTNVQPPVNELQASSYLKLDFSVHNVSLESSRVVINGAHSTDSDSHSYVSTTTSLNTSSQKSPDFETAKVLEPFKIEMGEGMFRTVKSDEGLTPEIRRLRHLLGEDYFYTHFSYAHANDKWEHKKESLAKTDKNFTNWSNSGQISNSKTPDECNRHKSSSEKPVVKSGKRKKNSPLNKITIEKCEKKVKLENHSDCSMLQSIFGSPIVLSKLNIKEISSSTKAHTKLVKSSSRGNLPVKSSSKVSLPVKSSSKGSPSVKLSTKGSSSTFIKARKEQDKGLKNGTASILASMQKAAPAAVAPSISKTKKTVRILAVHNR